MTLKEALAEFIEDLGYTGVFFFQEVTNGEADRVCLLRDGTPHDDDPTRFRKFPTVDVFFRDLTQAAAHQWATLAHQSLDTGRPLQLTPTYRVGRCKPTAPESQGRDDLSLWASSFTINFSVNYAALV